MRTIRNINLKGEIVSDSNKEMYEYYGVEHVSPSDIINVLNENPLEDITLVIDSIGGSINAGSEIFTALKEHKGSVTSKIVARAYSIASIVPLASDKILMSPSAVYMLHNASVGGVSGDYREMERKADMLKNMSGGLAEMYAQKTGLSVDEIKEMMDKETFLNAQQALDYGFIDEILFADASSLANDIGAVASHGGLTLTKEQIEAFNNKDKTEMSNKQKQLLELLKIKQK